VALARLPGAHQDIATPVSLAKRFLKILREWRGGELGGWLSEAEASGTAGFRQFARRVRQDEDAVRVGCTLVHSDEQTEGKITKLKAIKRSMYGRAKFDLLRRRALFSAVSPKPGESHFWTTLTEQCTATQFCRHQR